MKVQLNRGEEIKQTKRILITTELGSEFRISICHLTGGLIINKYDDDSSFSIIPRVSNEILLK